MQARPGGANQAVLSLGGFWGFFLVFPWRRFFGFDFSETVKVYATNHLVFSFSHGLKVQMSCVINLRHLPTKSALKAAFGTVLVVVIYVEADRLSIVMRDRRPVCVHSSRVQ